MIIQNSAGLPKSIWCICILTPSFAECFCPTCRARASSAKQNELHIQSFAPTLCKASAALPTSVDEFPAIFSLHGAGMCRIAAELLSSMFLKYSATQQALVLHAEKPPQVLASLKHIVILLLLAMSALKSALLMGLVQGKIGKKKTSSAFYPKKKSGFLVSFPRSNSGIFTSFFLVHQKHLSFPSWKASKSAQRASSPRYLTMSWRRATVTLATLCQWIGLRENLQETIDFPMKYGAFL